VECIATVRTPPDSSRIASRGPSGITGRAKAGSTRRAHLDLAELLALGQDEVHVLVERKHLADQVATIVSEEEQREAATVSPNADRPGRERSAELDAQGNLEPVVDERHHLAALSLGVSGYAIRAEGEEKQEYKRQSSKVSLKDEVRVR
jgi:hypothetical protein